jgi:hypothetical protein
LVSLILPVVASWQLSLFLYVAFPSTLFFVTLSCDKSLNCAMTLSLLQGHHHEDIVAAAFADFTATITMDFIAPLVWRLHCQHLIVRLPLLFI